MLVMGLRPDVIIRTGVIEPFSPVNAVGKARAVPGEFVQAVRPEGPAVSAAPATSEIAAAAEALSRHFAAGQGARVRIGRTAKKVYPNKKPTGVWGYIWAAAKLAAAGRANLVKAPAQPTAVVRPVGAQGGPPAAMPQGGVSGFGDFGIWKNHRGYPNGRYAFSDGLGAAMSPPVWLRDLRLPAMRGRIPIRDNVMVPSAARMHQVPQPATSPYMEIIRRSAFYVP